MIKIPARVNYLNNRELLSEIHKSKTSYCYFIDKQYSNYDVIVNSLDEITPELISIAKEKRASQLMLLQKTEQKSQGLKLHQIKIDKILPEEILVEDIVWRVMTYEHIPFDSNRSKKPKTESEKHIKVNFPPFKHYILRDGELVEVGRSHWVDGLHNGRFSQDHGKINNRLAMMFMKLVERYSQRSNWRGYTYVGEMKGQALMQLSLIGLQFDENRSDNPFAYYTVTVCNAFTRVLNLEKRNQNIRDDILIMHGASPSITRQLDDELQQKAANDAAESDDDNESAPVSITSTKRGAFGRSLNVKPKLPDVFTNTEIWETNKKNDK